MKKFVSAHVVASFDSGEFLKKLSEVIDYFQNDNLIVEVQYSATSNQLTALVMAYTYVEV